MTRDASGRDLVYVSGGAATVNVYDLAGLKQVATLSGFSRAMGECVDAKNNVWIADNGQVRSSSSRTAERNR